MLLYQSYQWMHAMDNIRLRKKLVKSFSQIRVAVTQCGNCGNYWHTFLTKRVDLTNFFWGDSEFFSTLWVNFSFVHTAKIFRQIDLHYNSLVKKLIWRNFCGKIVEEKLCNFYSCVYCTYTCLGIKSSKFLFKRGASQAAVGRFASVAAKLVKTATQIPEWDSILHARGNKSRAANLGHFFPVFVRQLKTVNFHTTCAWK